MSFILNFIFNKYQQYYIYIEKYTEHVSKSGTGRGDQGRRKRRKRKIVNNNEIHHICVGIREMKHTKNG
jgi:hypothetical protein